MNKRRKLIVILSTVVIILALGVTVSAQLWKNQKEKAIAPYYLDGTAATRKTTQLGEETQFLTYEKSWEKATGGSIHYYVDSAGNEYAYNSDDEMIGYYPVASDDAMATVMKTSTLTETEATELAEQYGAEFYGDSFSEFELIDCLYNESGDFYMITFGVKYKDAFIGEKCYVTIEENGDLRSAVSPNRHDMEDFDASLLENVKYEDILNLAREKHGECSLDSVEIVKEDGKFVLRFGVIIQADDIISTDVMVYELE